MWALVSDYNEAYANLSVPLTQQDFLHLLPHMSVNMFAHGNWMVCIDLMNLECFKSFFQLNYQVEVEKTRTKYGLCRTFNMLSVDDILFVDRVLEGRNSYRGKNEISNSQAHQQIISISSSEELFDLAANRDPEDFKQPNPYHSKHKDLGLDLHLFERPITVKFKSGYSNSGFKIMVHSPFEFPDETHQFYTVSLNRSYIFSIISQIRSIDDSLVDMSSEK